MCDAMSRFCGLGVCDPQPIMVSVKFLSSSFARLCQAGTAWSGASGKRNPFWFSTPCCSEYFKKSGLVSVPERSFRRPQTLRDRLWRKQGHNAFQVQEVHSSPCQTCLARLALPLRHPE